MPDQVPLEIRLTPPMLEQLKARTGYDDPAEYFDCEVRNVFFNPTREKHDFTQYFEAYPDKDSFEVDEWGVGWKRGSLYHFKEMIHPMRNFTSVKEIEQYPWPDVTADYRTDGLEERVAELKRKGYAVRGRIPEIDGTVFETAWRLRGMENFLVDLVLNKDLAHALLSKVTDLHIKNAVRMVKAGVDIMWFSEDFGTQRALILSLDLWREMIKPYLAKLFAAVRDANRDVLIFLHSDGAVQDLIPDLIEIGLDILNPVQPECMDPADVKQKYGERLAFWGTIGTQTTLPFGTREEIEETVKLRVKTVGKGGGLLLAPTHQVEPDVPWENLIAFAEAVRKYGRY